MLLLHALKLWLGNLQITWKNLLYRAVVVLIFAGIFMGLIQPLVNEAVALVQSHGIVESLNNLWETMLHHPEIFPDAVDQFRETIMLVWQELFENTSSFALWYAIIIAFIVLFRFCRGLAEYPVYMMLSARMSRNASLSFLGTFFSQFGKSCRMQLCVLLVALPLELLFIFVAMVLLNALVPVLETVGLVLVVLIAVMLFTFRFTLVNGWRAACVVEGMKPFAAFKKSLGYTFRSFAMVFSHTLVLIIGLYLLNANVAHFTVGAGAPFTLIFSNMLFTCYELAFYYTVTHRKYYLDTNSIVCPRAQSDCLSIEQLLEEERIAAEHAAAELSASEPAAPAVAEEAPEVSDTQKPLPDQVSLFGDKKE
ncbi:MAG: hypothetical protein IJF71_07155 [Clostridia bacterium]|nr:hypothetical protein [Clostridia bacterium]